MTTYKEKSRSTTGSGDLDVIVYQHYDDDDNPLDVYSYEFKDGRVVEVDTSTSEVVYTEDGVDITVRKEPVTLPLSKRGIGAVGLTGAAFGAAIALGIEHLIH